ncbi:hypothetical protein KS4_33680 [Poriferisphaera corsica]|uniref:Uncharacterized protein n=1 Tax=Poriferisphaera corsica TaxID=2528020 RepID=A0A517YYL3_9BACT|nr:hypothetical protein KS4_33680 [Poriferisphaera corsica]
MIDGGRNGGVMRLLLCNVVAVVSEKANNK